VRFGSAYSYTGSSFSDNNSFYEISTFFPELKNWCGLLAGLIYSLPYAGFDLITVKITDKVNRNFFLSFVVCLASAIMGIRAATSSFSVFYL